MSVATDSRAEQASRPSLPAAGFQDVSSATTDTSGFTCARSADGALRCWGFGGDGRLGYGNVDTIGDDETPGAVAPLGFGPGRTVVAVSAGAFHACALVDDGTVHCWGYGADGRLGYGNTQSIGDDESTASAGAVDLGPGRTATAISAGGGHTCAVLDDGSVRCWGFGEDGRLGYGNPNSIGDDETPGSVPPVDLGAGRTATAITTGASDTCALLDNGRVLCWGLGANGQLGYGDTTTIGQAVTPGFKGPVDLGPGRTATAISAGSGHTCAVLDDGSVRCWGFGGNGRLGYGNTQTIGDNETPGSAGPVELGPGRTATAISAGDNHTCAMLDDATVRCWGFAGNGRLGYANTNDIGDTETPVAAGAVDLGPGRTATAISAGGRHTCARLDDQSIRCWGAAALGRLGYCHVEDIGDNETPGSAGPVNLTGASAGCDAVTGPALPAAGPAAPGVTAGPARPPAITAEAAQSERAARLRSCLRRARRSSPAGRRVARHRCLSLHGRTPGRVRGLNAKATGRTTLTLRFRAPGTDGAHPPAATRYQIEQARGSSRATALCGGTCRFAVTAVGTQILLEVTHLRPGTTYRYAVRACDNVSGRHGRTFVRAQVHTRR
jgi:alpha-tubulin suppressor-like RCC1 family protein